MREPLNGKVRAARRWLFGCGLAYALLFAVQVAAGPQLCELMPLSALTLAALLVSTPHYGATLLRV